ncbi:MAG: FecR domain-containing protein [Polyangiaceae bacterium]|jgi:hypothetical protein
MQTERIPTLDGPAAELVDLARRSLSDMTEKQRIAGLQTLRNRLLEQRRLRMRRRITFVAGGALCGAACMGAFVWHRPEHAGSLSVRVDGAELRAGGAVEARTDRPVIHFSDGSEITLATGAKLHVRSLEDHGAHVTLDEGDAKVYVVHARETHWSFDAGPYVVAVTGTAFGLSWSESAQRLDVRLENGSVTVSGPASDTPLSLRAGQWLTVRGNEVLIRGLASGDGGESANDEPSTPLTGHTSTAAPNIAFAPSTSATAVLGHRSAERDAHRHHWAVDLAHGRFDAIVDQAVTSGLEAAYAESTSEDLAALADAARYTRREDIARGALSMERRRFAGSERARTAAFHLARMAENDGNAQGALSWFDVYLAESPDGIYASDALGHKMRLVQSLEGTPAARSLAETYLHKFPGGVYAEAARALTATP